MNWSTARHASSSISAANSEPIRWDSATRSRDLRCRSVRTIRDRTRRCRSVRTRRRTRAPRRAAGGPYSTIVAQRARLGARVRPSLTCGREHHRRRGPPPHGLGIEIQGLYTPPISRGGIPTRSSAPPASSLHAGVHREMYRRRLWTMRQYAGFGTASPPMSASSSSSAPARRSLVCVRFPTQMGYDSDHPRAEARSARSGGHRLARGHAHPARRPATRHRHDVDDDQRHGFHPAVALPACGRGAGGAGGEDPRTIQTTS